MCFSAQASFLASGILTVGGIATLSQVRYPEQRAFAFFPLIFALHQFIEGCLWLTRSYPASPAWVEFLSHAFPFIAYVVWPALLPYAVDRCEHVLVRRKLLLICRSTGAALGIFYLYYISKGPVTAVFVNQSIHYEFYFSFWILSQWLYGFSIIGATLVSSHKIVNLFGIGLIIAYNIAKQFYLASYPSIFCHLAAWLSLIIFVEVRYQARSAKKAPDTQGKAETARQSV
ncbi:MAG: DUF6629 family protein [Methylococcales bacterium]